MDAAAAEMKRMREMTGASATDPGKKAADTAKREAEAVKEIARNRTIANEQARIDSARAERDIRRRAALEKAASEDARRSRAREVTAAREQARVDETRRAAEAKAAREARLRELATKRELQRQDNMRAAAQRNAETERLRMEERVAASIARRTGRNVQDILAEQRAAGQAAEQAAQQATRAESRWRRLGQTMRNAARGVRWGRVAGEAGAEIGKQIAKSVAEGMMKGVRDGATGARGLMDRATGGQGTRGAVRAGAGAGWGLISEGWGRNQQGISAENAVRNTLSVEQTRAARAAAEAATKHGLGLVTPGETLEAMTELGKNGFVADPSLMKAFVDTAVASQGKDTVGQIATDYVQAMQDKALDGFVRRRGGSVTTGDDGSQTLTYKRDGQDIERRVTAGDRAGIDAAIREFMARNEGMVPRQLATPKGATDAAFNTLKATTADALEDPFRKATEWMEKLNAAIAGADGAGAKRLGQQIAEGMSEAEKTVVSITTSVSNMMGPVDRVAQALGGWKVAIGGMVALGFAGWLGSVAAGIRAVGGASVFLAGTPAGRAMLGAAAGGYLMHDIWSGKAPEPGSLQANAQAEMRVLKQKLANAWVWANTEIGKEPKYPTEPAMPAAPAAATGPSAEKQAQAAQAGEKAAQALAMIEQVAPAARQMVSEVDGILAATDFTSRGVAMMTTLAAGIRAGSGAAVGAVREVTQQIRDHLPHSPAKVGPLSDLDRVKFSETLATAIRPDAAIRAVRNMVAGMRGAIPDTLMAGGGFGASPALARAAGGAGPELDAALHKATMAAAYGADAAVRSSGFGAAEGSALAKAAGGASAELDQALQRATMAAALGPEAEPRDKGFGASPALAKAAGGASPELDEALRQATLAAAYGPDSSGAIGGRGKREVPAVTSRAGPQNSLSVSYAPNVTFNGGEVGDFWSQLESHKDSLVGMIEGSFSRGADLSFG